MDSISNRKLIANKIEKNEPIHLSFKFINEEILMLLNSIIARVLAKNDQIYLLNSIITILREVIINALKANAKRAFFRKNNFSLTDPRDYERGMAAFKKQIIGDFNNIEGDLKRSDMHVQIHISYSPQMIRIAVINNAQILPVELERVKYRIQKAIQYNDFSEAYAEIEDETEGAGLGIVLTILLLKNMGIDPSNYAIDTHEKNTRTTLTIPAMLKPEGITTKIKERILAEIDGIPTFPENIIQLQRLCNDPRSSIDQIVSRIKIDPALSSDVIKLSNSAGIAAGKRIEDIKSAVVTIGLKNVNAILTACNARRILNERYQTFEMIWDHCNKVAFYARQLALNAQMTDILESVYTAGLLHDLGKIILLATDRKLVKQIADIVKDRKITTTTMEEIAIGISHSSIGSMISRKWNFPEYLTESILNHHSPLNAGDRYRDIVHTTYLANMMVGIEDRKYSYYYIEESILERYELEDYEKFNSFHERLKKRYASTAVV